MDHSSHLAASYRRKETDEHFKLIVQEEGVYLDTVTPTGTRMTKRERSNRNTKRKLVLAARNVARLLGVKFQMRLYCRWTGGGEQHMHSSSSRYMTDGPF